MNKDRIIMHIDMNSYFRVKRESKESNKDTPVSKFDTLLCDKET